MTNFKTTSLSSSSNSLFDSFFDFDKDLDILWRNVFDNSSFNALSSKINYPVDVYETQSGLVVEIAAVGVDSEDVSVEVQGDILHVKCNRQVSTEDRKVHTNQIAKRSFDFQWKVSPKFDVSKSQVSLDKGLLKIEIPIGETVTKKIIPISVGNGKKLLMD